MEFDDYFDSYAGVRIHRIMLADRVRLDAYRDAIEALVEPGMTVLDVGAGTGILSMFAARAGASRVYAVDQSEILTATRELIAVNGMSDRVRCIAGLVEEITLPEKVDLIVSEWMGYFALTESMFESVIAARKRHLKPGGRMIPAAIRLFVTPVADRRLHMENGLGFWQEPLYGFDYSPMIEYELRELETCSRTGLGARALAEPALVADIDCQRDPARDYWFDTELEITIERDGEWQGLLGHFEAETAPGTVLSTAAEEPPTHWRQSWFPMHGREVRAGDRILLAMRAYKDPRGDGRRPMFQVSGTLLHEAETLDEFSYRFIGTFD